jgi:bacterial/archaeal transporter family-2 protein
LVTNLFLLLALATGAGIAAQAVINARLRVVLGAPLWAAGVQTLVGLVLIVAVALALRQPGPLTADLGRAPWWVWTGGMLGATYVVVSIILVPRLGTALMLATMIVGQLVFALLIDHYGWFGATPVRLTPSRVLGVGLLIGGFLLLRWR